MSFWMCRCPSVSLFFEISLKIFFRSELSLSGFHKVYTLWITSPWFYMKSSFVSRISCKLAGRSRHLNRFTFFILYLGKISSSCCLFSWLYPLKLIRKIHKFDVSCKWWYFKFYYFFVHQLDTFLKRIFTISLSRGTFSIRKYDKCSFFWFISFQNIEVFPQKTPKWPGNCSVYYFMELNIINIF